MIVVDTSALMAILLNEPDGTRCIEAIAADPLLAISAGTLAEATIVASRHGARAALERLIARIKPEIVPLAAVEARRVGDAYDRWGKGIHAAGLNFGDCFAYALATQRGCRLLYVGNDFAKTDVVAA